MHRLKYIWGAVAGLALFGAVSTARASYDGGPSESRSSSFKRHHSVPELSSGAAGSGLVLIAGTLLVLAGRKRKHGGS